MRRTLPSSLRLLGCCVVLLSGCTALGARMFTVSVDAINDPDYSGGTTYILLSPDPTIDATSNLLFREYGIMVERVMETRGYTRTSSEQDADLAVFLSYGIGDPELNIYTDTVFNSTNSYTTYSRNLQLDAQILHDSQQVWNVRVGSTGTSGNLRDVIPVMLAAAEPYIGDNTNGAVSMRLLENSQRVQSVKGTTGEE